MSEKNKYTLPNYKNKLCNTIKLVIVGYVKKQMRIYYLLVRTIVLKYFMNQSQYCRPMSSFLNSIVLM